jgi:hypothetical protein
MYLLNSVKAYESRIRTLQHFRLYALHIKDYIEANKYTRSINKAYCKMNQLKQRLRS